jgi:hypothetical protein
MTQTDVDKPTIHENEKYSNRCQQATSKDLEELNSIQRMVNEME